MTIKLSRRDTIAGLGAAMGAFALPACRSSDKGFDAEVIILGAGLSGLHAARILAGEGKDVLVLEGSNRIGGRLYTLDHGDGYYTEGGGEQVGASYARIIDTASQLGVTLDPDSSVPRKTSYFYKGKLYAPDEWAGLEAHPFPAPFKGSSAGSPLFRLAAKNNPLQSPTDWRDPTFAEHDISATEFLKQHGFDAEARRVMDVALNGNSLDTYSMMNLYRSLQLFSQSRDMGPSLSVKGGAQRLPEAMAASLPRPVLTGSKVIMIETNQTGVLIRTNANKTYRAEHCICALPFPALGSITIHPGLPSIPNEAVQGLPYTQIYQIHFQADKPFWEQDGLPADMWTDSPLERIFANRDKDGSPTGIFRAWINGAGTNPWAGKNASESSRQFLSEFERIRPAASGTLKVLGTADWTTANPRSGGAYMHWAPGQISQWAGKMGTPAGRLSFAGEHLSYLHTGMEGAMESGENAALALLGI